MFFYQAINKKPTKEKTKNKREKRPKKTDKTQGLKHSKNKKKSHEIPKTVKVPWNTKQRKKKKLLVCAISQLCVCGTKNET